MDSLHDSLTDWTDVDFAQYQVAICLGLMPEGIMPGRAKGIFWSRNPVGDAMYKFLTQLTEIGVLERRDEPDIQFRWNPAFHGDWE